ncbi:GNAT family acetyltransferase [Starkeya koreensis]|uniref:GNAT family acetyltransferase n=1 Tax=Ancylobacter koreensis TaxID=266121 RepID=A0ABT0DMT6_9HYPH|nr:GNAT family acetyltransferase [Ancylobacter koreensis]MCK0208587.1 GNAT family acetyltransferase [Ancylobacter koreensis]
MSLFIRIVFAVAACALMAVAAILLVYAPYMAIRDSLAGGQAIHGSLLAVVGYLIVAIALFDVAKYFFEEEVPAGREKRTAADARRGLTKFISTIVIAIFLEALVLVFETAREDVADVVYAALLLAAGCLTLVSLGVFQRLSASTEREVGPEPEAQEGGEGPVEPAARLASRPANG